jgi:hypothetical protein
MYVASLNIDLLFKKVFSNPEIAKSFLQDFLGILITEIIVLNIEYKLSDDAVIVKFDYRCKINGEYVIIEMQQKYKKDVIKRFYLYHCLDTSLQLETLKPIEITRPNGETYKEKDYSGVEPVLTIIWMVDDTLGFEDDFIVFTTLPERTKDFIKDETLWSQSLETILAERAETLKILNNDTKGLGFLQENKIIYAFQDNIVKNRRNKPYGKWFELAKKSKNSKNKKSDFDEFKNDKVMVQVLRRLERTKLEPSEYKHVSDIYQYEYMLEEKKQEAVQAQQEAVQLKQEAVQSKQEAVQSKQEAERAQQEAALQAKEAVLQAKEAALQKERAEKAEKAGKENTLKFVRGLLMLGKDVPYIASILELPVEEIYSLVQQIKENS